MKRFTFPKVKVTKPQRFKEPTRAELDRAYESWKKFAPKEAKALLKKKAT